jgi:hypothetical protein
MKYTREEYMQNKVSHEEFYGQFITEGLKNCVARHIGMDAINASKDKHFNDIRLELWDTCPVPLDVLSEIKKANGRNGYSLSDRVCVAKECARQLKEASKKIFG